MSFTIKGSIPSANHLPTNNNRQGDAYLAKGTLYVWTGIMWVVAGEDNPSSSYSINWKGVTVSVPMFAPVEEIFEDISNPTLDEIKMLEVLYPHDSANFKKAWCEEYDKANNYQRCY